MWGDDFENVKFYNRPVWLYVLKLSDDCWYIGLTRDILRRTDQHFSGEGALFTKAHPPIKVVRKEELPFTKLHDVIPIETAVTMEYIKKYGSDKVRGGEYVYYDHSNLPHNVI